MSKKHRKAWRASVQRENAAATTTQSDTNDAPRETPPHQLRGRARQQWIEQQVQEMDRQRVGDTIDLLIDSCSRTSAAFISQMKEAKGEGEAWGPDVTPYENRMTGSLIARLLREKRTWLRDFRQQIEQALADEAAMEAEEAADEETGAPSASDGLANAKDNQAQQPCAIDPSPSAPDASPGHQDLQESPSLAQSP